MSTPSSEAPWAAGLRGARANLVPGLVLQGLALGLVVAYYQAETARAALAHLTTWRDSWGILFPVLTTGLCGGVLPALFLWARPATRRTFSLAQALALTAFWAYKGAEIDLWYRFLALTVGEATTPGTIAVKMALDQFVWCPLWAIPSTVVVYAWVNQGFDRAAVWADLRRPRWYARAVLPVLVSNLGVWVPTVCIIYALPTPLQLPLQNLILVFFTLLMAHLTTRKE